MPSGLLRLDAEDRRRERVATAKLLSAIRNCEVNAFIDAFSEIDNANAWKQAFRACARIEAAPDAIRCAFLDVWIYIGDTLRSNVDEDLTLIRALRVLLPVYSGGSIMLFRGECAGNLKRRTFGMSWSSNRRVAAEFARSRTDLYAGGMVVIEVMAPPTAIISAPGLICPQISVDEYIVDRRYLSKVKAIQIIPPADL